MNNTDRLYIAYGSNLNLEQMEYRCPTAKIVSAVELQNWRLRFRGGRRGAVATIEPAEGFKVPALIWQLLPQDERTLDRYEGYPFLYRKETLRLTLDRRPVSAMVYIMNEFDHPYGTPTANYLNIIREGYISCGFNLDILTDAAAAASGEVKS